MQHAYVPRGKQTPGSEYDPDTDTFTAPAGWVDPSADDTDKKKSGETTEEAAAAVAAAAAGGFEETSGDWGTSYDDFDPLYELPGKGWTWDPMSRLMIAPDGTPFDPSYPPDLNKMYEYETKLQADRETEAAAAAAAQDAEDKAAAAAAAQDAEDEAAAAAKKTVPDVDPVGTHIHDQPVQRAPRDTTLPIRRLGHIPLL